ncbi:unnamed protein product, partial [Prorocentrum cordatum]
PFWFKCQHAILRPILLSPRPPGTTGSARGRVAMEAPAPRLQPSAGIRAAWAGAAGRPRERPAASPLLACGAALLGPPPRRGRRCARAAATATKRVTKTRTLTQTQTQTKSQTKSQTKTENRWALLVHAPARQNRWWQFWKPIAIRVGLAELTVRQFSDLLADAVGELSPSDTFRAACALAESAMMNEIGIAAIVSAERHVVEKYQQQLRRRIPHLDVSVAPE